MPGKRAPLSERLAAKVDRSAGPDGCWPFTGYRMPSGYGRIHALKGMPMALAHRAAWEEAHGPIPDGMEVLHACDNPPCCNPYGEKHLHLGTQQENVDEAKERGLIRRGSRKRLAKLNEETVRMIRASSDGVRSLARQLGVSPPVVCVARSGKAWRHVEMVSP